MRAPVDPAATRGTADTRWGILQNLLVSGFLLVGMGFLGRDLLHYLLHDVWDWTTARDLIGDVRTGWPGLDSMLRVLLSLHMAVFCVIVAWILGQGRKKGQR